MADVGGGGGGGGVFLGGGGGARPIATPRLQRQNRKGFAEGSLKIIRPQAVEAGHIRFAAIVTADTALAVHRQLGTPHHNKRVSRTCCMKTSILAGCVRSQTAAQPWVCAVTQSAEVTGVADARRSGRVSVGEREQFGQFRLVSGGEKPPGRSGCSLIRGAPGRQEPTWQTSRTIRKAAMDTLHEDRARAAHRRSGR